MAAHPGLSFSSSFLRETSGLTSTPQAFRHRYHTRRKRSATATAGMAAALGGSGKIGRRHTGAAGGGTNSGGGEACVTTPVSSASQPEHPPEDEGASDMLIDVDAGVIPPAAATATGGSGGGCGGGEVDQSVCRWGRVLSCPAVEHYRTASASTVRPAAATAAAAAAPGLGGAFVVTGSADNVSSARGITIGDINGAVRAKTAPEEDQQAPAQPSASAEAAEAAAAAVSTTVATATETAIAGHYSDIATAKVVSMSLSGEEPKAGGTGPAGDTEGDTEGERTFRATSSGASFLCAPVPAASNKRAKSGASSAVGASLGEQAAWMTTETAAAPERPQPAHEEAHPTPAEALSSMSIDSSARAAATAATPPSENDGDGAVAAAAAGPAVAAAEAAAAAATATPVTAATEPEKAAPVALSNEEWLSRLSPHLESIPAGTHPEDYLHDILRERGYTTEMVAMKETIFHRPPDADQVAAYDKAILRAVVDEDEAALERMRAAGRRMDACNRFGDSVLHMACRRGRATALRFLIRATGPSGVVLSDDFGRTVMHDACWTAAPRFDVASAVLDSDTRLLRTLDSRGSSPLQYVPQDQWPLWCAFFESRKEVYWPQLPPGAEDLAGIIPLTV